MKKFNEQERYYARKNREMDMDEASGVDKGREQGGLKPLFEGEV